MGKCSHLRLLAIIDRSRTRPIQLYPCWLSRSPLRPPTCTYQPKFPGDPARSDSEAAALAYMRVVIRAQHRFKSSTATSPLR